MDLFRSYHGNKFSESTMMEYNRTPMINQPFFLQLASIEIINGQEAEGIMRIRNQKLSNSMQDRAFQYMVIFLLFNAQFDKAVNIAEQIDFQYLRELMIKMIYNGKVYKSIVMPFGVLGAGRIALPTYTHYQLSPLEVDR
jgi:hypothetical protein